LSASPEERWDEGRTVACLRVFQGSTALRLSALQNRQINAGGARLQSGTLKALFLALPEHPVCPFPLPDFVFALPGFRVAHGESFRSLAMTGNNKTKNIVVGAICHHCFNEQTALVQK
jgi:hypothetical protein